MRIGKDKKSTACFKFKQTKKLPAGSPIKMIIMLTIPVILQAAYALALLLGSKLFRVYSDIKGPFRGLFLLP